jgi:hypothetical protein
METNHEDRWVADQLASIDPQWTPNLAHGRELLQARLTHRRHSRIWIVAAAATAAVCMAMLAVPGTRALAQELWYTFVLNRVDVVRLDLSNLPLHTHLTTNGLEQSVQNIDEAERKAGFRPHLPSPAVLSTTPDISVTGPITVQQTIHVRDIESALNKVGASDVHVPAEWDGLQLRTQIGSMVEANYPDNIRILQAQPIELSVPPGFALEDFAAAAFRSIGVSSWQARAMARKFAAHPAWFLDIPPDAVVNVQEVALKSTPALVIEDLDAKGAVKRATVVWSTSERMYSVSSKSRELSVKIANDLA